MLKNVTVTLEEEALRWARRAAADQGTSVSKLLGGILEREARRTDSYWRAYERWQKIKLVRMSGPIRKIRREEIHERGR